MDQEQLQQQFEALAEECRELNEQSRHRSAFRKITEAKRFAKTHGMLTAYLYACRLTISTAGSLHEPDIGIENAVEQIAILESEDKARKFQKDFDPDEYSYAVYHYTAQAYLDLAFQTALKYGFNSPLVHGTIDDGVHICRRTGNLAFIDEFRVFANYMAIAAGDYDMAEYYARLTINNTTGEYAAYDILFAYRTLTWIYERQGKLNAALQTLERAAREAKDFEDKNWLENTFYRWVDLLCRLAGREEDIPALLRAFGLSGNPRELPSAEEDPSNFLDFTVNDAVKLCLEGHFPEAIKRITEQDRMLLANHCLCEWYEVRYKRLSLILMARQSGLEIDENLDELAADLRRRAEAQCHWSAIQTLDSLFPPSVKLNPIGIPFPIDIGPFATPGTPLSQAVFDLELPLDDATIAAPEDAPVKASKEDDGEKSPLEQEADAWFAALEPLWNEFREHKQRRRENPDDTEPFPRETELAELERDVYAKVFAHKPEEDLSEEEFVALARSILWMNYLQTPERLRESWDWLTRFAAKYPRRGRPLAVLAYHAMFYRDYARELSIDPPSLGLPDDEHLAELALKAIELEPNRSGVATTSGIVLWNLDRLRDAKRCFARACQLDRLNTYATGALATLYDQSDRPNDALVVYDLYMRAGGGEPGLFWEAMQLAFRTDKPRAFLLYFKAYASRTGGDEIHPMLDAQKTWALARLGRFAEALDALDVLDAKLGDPGRDRLLFRALCHAELDRDGWAESLAAALDHADGAERLLGTAFDPGGPLWEHVRKWDAEDALRRRFEDFLYVRNLLPDSFFLQNEPQDEDESEGERTDEKTEDDKPPLKGYFRCVLRQPLEAGQTAYAGWVPFSEGTAEYLATWTVLADDEDEALRLAVEAQSRCATLLPEPLECEQLDSYYGSRSQIVYQGRRDLPEIKQEPGV